MRSIRAGVASTLLVLWLATAAWAQNGLERFEKELKPQFELKSFTYANAAPLGSSGFVLNDVVAVIPANAATGDKESTVKIQKVTVDALDFDRMKKDAKDDEAPRFAKLKLEGMTGDDEMFTALQPYGVPNVPFDIALDYSLDPATKVLDAQDAGDRHARPGQARAVADDGRHQRQDQRHGRRQGRRPPAHRVAHDRRHRPARQAAAGAGPRRKACKPEELVQTALTGIAAFAAQQGPDTLKALDAVASFIADWKSPKGPLVLGLKPAKTAGLADLDKVAMPDALTTEFGFTATYPGTKAGAAKAGAK